MLTTGGCCCGPDTVGGGPNVRAYSLRSRKKNRKHDGDADWIGGEELARRDHRRSVDQGMKLKAMADDDLHMMLDQGPLGAGPGGDGAPDAQRMDFGMVRKPSRAILSSMHKKGSVADALALARKASMPRKAAAKLITSSKLAPASPARGARPPSPHLEWTQPD